MDTERIKAFFFEAMRNGWAAGVEKEPVTGLPGSKSINYQQDDLFLSDYYFVASGSDSSYGTTVIWTAERIDPLRLRKKPVWVMHYGGWYDKSVIPFLKLALRHNYEENIFLGGRGPIMLMGEYNVIQYLNWNEENDFKKFNGYEQIIKLSDGLGSVGQKMGEHYYFGGTL